MSKFKPGDEVAVSGFVDTVEEEDGTVWVRVKLPGQTYLEFRAEDITLVEEKGA